MLNKYLYILWMMFPILLFSQNGKYPVTNLPVEQNGVLFKNPFTGGMNAPQFSSVDLNNDGIKDLFVFDRAGDNVLTFLNDGTHSDTSYHYAPQYENHFPAMTAWAVLRDCNYDGIPDIFCYQPGGFENGVLVPTGIKVFKGSRQGGSLHYELLKSCLYYYAAPDTIPLWVNSLGLPAIIDVNHDGDLDVLTFNVYGTTVEYYENQTIELGLNPDSIVFSQVSECWGNFYVSASNNLQISLNTSCKGGEANQHEDGGRHSGAALSAFDYGDDGDVDLLVTGVHANYMQLLNNTETSSYANAGWKDTLWPSCNSPIRMPYFPGAYYIDADNDGLNDLLVSPVFSAPALDVRNVLFYKKIDNGDSCDYVYTNNDTFLVRTSLDFGTDSKGIFFDYNGDGLMDIVVGNYGYYDLLVPAISKVALLENVGTSSEPKFNLVTNDYQGLSQYSAAGGIQGMNPAFGDLDGDHLPDMLLGDVSGNVHFFKNTGGAVASFPAMTTPNYDSINVGSYAAPFIYDVNGDSLPDLVIGRRDGKLSYYWNYGTTTHPLFSNDSVNNNFGNVNVTDITATVDGYSQPFITKDSAGQSKLFVGSLRGLVSEYAIDGSKLRNGSFALLDSDFMHYHPGFKSTFQACDLNGDGKPEYLIGNSRGGLQMFSETVWDSSALAIKDIPVDEQPVIFPNPSAGYFVCELHAEDIEHLNVVVWNIFRQIQPVTYTVEGDQLRINASTLCNGVYILRVTNGKKSYKAKFVIAR